MSYKICLRLCIKIYKFKSMYKNVSNIHIQRATFRGADIHPHGSRRERAARRRGVRLRCVGSRTWSKIGSGKGPRRPWIDPTDDLKGPTRPDRADRTHQRWRRGRGRPSMTIASHAAILARTTATARAGEPTFGRARHRREEASSARQASATGRSRRGAHGRPRPRRPRRRSWRCRGSRGRRRRAM